MDQAQVNHNTTSPERRATAEERRLVEAWACLSKAIAIYPDSNQRVQASVGVFLETFTAVSRGRDLVTLLARPDAFVVAGGTVEMASVPQLPWLKERLDRVGLAGLQLRQPVVVEALLAFSRKLVHNSQWKPDEKSRHEFAHDAFPGIELIERRFGTVAGGAADPQATTAALRVAISERGMEVAALLESNPGIAGRLEALQQALKAGAHGQDAPVDLLGRLATLLPAEVVADERTLVAKAELILDQLLQAIPDLSKAGNVKASLSHLMFSISRKLFFRRGELTEPVALTEGDLGGHAGDEQVLDDLDALLQEVGQLPKIVSADQVLAEAEMVDERLAAYLHYLVSFERAAQRRTVYPRLVQILARPTYDSLVVLRSFVATLPERGPDGLQRLQAFLREAGLMGVPSCGIVPLNRVVESFPNGFAMLLDMLNPRLSADLDALVLVCGAVGVDRILDNASALLRQGGLQQNGRAAMILGRPDPRVTPLVHLLLVEGGEAVKSGVFRFMRSLDLAHPQALPVRLAKGPNEVSLRYLQLLSSRTGDGRYPGELDELVAAWLADLLEQRDVNLDAAERAVAYQTLHRLLRQAACAALAAMEEPCASSTKG